MHLGLWEDRITSKNVSKTPVPPAKYTTFGYLHSGRYWIYSTKSVNQRRPIYLLSLCYQEGAHLGTQTIERKTPLCGTQIQMGKARGSSCQGELWCRFQPEYRQWWLGMCSQGPGGGRGRSSQGKGGGAVKPVARRAHRLYPRCISCGDGRCWSCSHWNGRKCCGASGLHWWLWSQCSDISCGWTAKSISLEFYFLKGCRIPGVPRRGWIAL